jgi:molybdopterin-binding protein
MKLSARNQLKGTVRSVKMGAVMAEVVVDIGGQEVVSVVTRDSVEHMGIKQGEPIVVVIKATEVMLGRE